MTCASPGLEEELEILGDGTIRRTGSDGIEVDYRLKPDNTVHGTFLLNGELRTIVFSPYPNGKVGVYYGYKDPRVGATREVRAQIVVPDSITDEDFSSPYANKLNNPAQWGPVASLANRAYRVIDESYVFYRVSDDGDGIQAVTLSASGQATVVFIIRVLSNGDLVMYRPGLSRESEPFRTGQILDSNTVRWRTLGSNFAHFTRWTITPRGKSFDKTEEFVGNDGSVGYKAVFVFAEYRFDEREIDLAFNAAQPAEDVFFARFGERANMHAAREARETRRRVNNQRWQQAVGAVYDGLSAVDSETRAREAQSRFELDSTIADMNAQLVARQAQESQANADRSNTAYSAAPVVTLVSPQAEGASPQRVAAPGTGSGAGIVVTSQEPPTPSPGSSESTNNIREAFIVCEVIRHGNFEGNNGALFQSEVGRVTIRDNRVQGDPENTFLGKVQSAYGVGDLSLCETSPDAQRLEALRSDWRRAYPGYKLVMTGTPPL